MDNYKFTSLLASTPLCEEDIYNLSVIFRALSDMRKQDIIDHWSEYFARIIDIHTKGESEKKTLLISTFQHINNLIDDAYIRDQERLKLNSMNMNEREGEVLKFMQFNKEHDKEYLTKLSTLEIQYKTLLDHPQNYM